MSQQNLRTEFLNEILSTLSDEVKALRENLPSNNYIDILKYVEWLENKLAEVRLNKPIKRTK
jgi:hypothetical protein